MSPSTRRKARRPRKSSKAPAALAATRAQKVWISFLGAMTLVGGLLLVLDGRPVPRGDGQSLPALAAATTGSAATDPIFATRQPLDRARWQSIVIHHSGSTVGSPAAIEREHEARNIRGLGHHFIIGNGKGMNDAQLHLGFRWLDQLPGAHAAGPNGDWYNHHAVSICLVGDGNRRGFTPAQIQRLTSLVASLREQFAIPADQVYLHSDLAQVSDPGPLFPAAAFRSALGVR